MVGEHIRVLRQGRWIHAIDCGDETVLHLAEEAPPARIRRAYRPEFVAGAAAVEIVTHRERTFPAKEIVRRAYSRASDPALASMFRDSEAFVEWCATGRLSAQRNVVLDAATGAAPPPAAATPAPRAPAPPARAAKRAPARKTASPKPARKASATARAKPARAKPKPKPAVRRPAARAAKRAPPKAKPARRAAKPARKARR